MDLEWIFKYENKFLQLNDKDFASLCQINKTFRSLCNSDEIWEKRAQIKLGDDFPEFKKELDKHEGKVTNFEHAYHMYRSFEKIAPIKNGEVKGTMEKMKDERITWFIDIKHTPYGYTFSVKYSKTKEGIYISTPFWVFTLNDKNRVLFRQFLHYHEWTNVSIKRLEEYLFHLMSRLWLSMSL